jgi:hypothetical protein
MGTGTGSEPAAPRDGARAWVQGSSLFGSSAGSQGGRPDTFGVRGWRGDWVSRLLIRATPAAPDAGSEPLAASPAGGAAAGPGNALPGIAALAAAWTVGSFEISAHGGRLVPAPAG